MLRRGCLVLLLALFLTIRAWPQQMPPDLTDKSLEDLMNTEVTSVSKKEQKLSQVAAAIFVITQEDIRRSGATDIPDLLRMVPGMDVGEINGSTWAVSARGFNQQFSNKLLVMIDRRIVYTATFAGVFWDTLDLPLEDIERIEVIRGPGGAVWGANAVNGVISIFTKKASETRGGLIAAGGGNVQQGFGFAQYGGALGKHADYRVYTKYFNQNHMLDPTGQNGADGWHTFRSGFRIDSTLSPKDSFMLEGDLSVGREGEFGFVLPSVTSPGFVPVTEQIDIADGNFVSVWDHSFSDRSNTTLQISFDRHLRDDPQNPERRDTWDVDFQHHVAWGERQDIVWGLGYRITPDRIEGSLTVSMNPVSRDLQVFNAFVQDEFALIPNKLFLTLGSKFEHNDYTGFEFMPDVRLAWAPSIRHMLWAALLAGLACSVAERHKPGPESRHGTRRSAHAAKTSGQSGFQGREIDRLRDGVSSHNLRPRLDRFGGLFQRLQRSPNHRARRVLPGGTSSARACRPATYVRKLDARRDSRARDCSELESDEPLDDQSRICARTTPHAHGCYEPGYSNGDLYRRCSSPPKRPASVTFRPA